MMRKFLIFLSWEFLSRRVESGRYSSVYYVIRVWGFCMCYCFVSFSILRLDYFVVLGCLFIVLSIFRFVIRGRKKIFFVFFLKERKFFLGVFSIIFFRLELVYKFSFKLIISERMVLFMIG